MGACQHTSTTGKAQTWSNLVAVSLWHRRQQQRSQQAQTHPSWARASTRPRPERRRPGATWSLSSSSIGDSKNGPNRHRPIHHWRASLCVHGRHRPCGTSLLSLSSGEDNSCALTRCRPITPIVKVIKPYSVY